MATHHESVIWNFRNGKLLISIQPCNCVGITSIFFGKESYESKILHAWFIRQGRNN
jgi:hypothetical protein